MGRTHRQRARDQGRDAVAARMLRGAALRLALMAGVAAFATVLSLAAGDRAAPGLAAPNQAVDRTAVPTSAHAAPAAERAGLRRDI